MCGVCVLVWEREKEREKEKERGPELLASSVGVALLLRREVVRGSLKS